ncbi:MAG: SGNH/GDSL hydrolase family protein [Gemmatimonadetes bacterium]|nr:SGNH/GDSL hydrolase family protein [Gemmatimonadota bacterium]
MLNAGCSGYGIDQMLFKGLRESHKHKPDLIIFSFIPHDLIRVSKNFMYGRGKPKITFTGDTISVDPVVNAGLRHDSYERTLNGSSLLYWYLQNEIWPNAEYYAPELYRKYCRKVYTYIYEQMATLAKERRLEVVFVKLTNSFEFRGEKTLISVAEEVFSTNTAAGLSYYDMDECIGREIDLDDPESDSMFYFHPTAEGHRLFAEGLSELITSANRQHAPQSH